MPTKIFAGRYESLAKIGEFIVKAAQDAGFDSANVYEIQLAVDEACTNIIEHGYGGEDRGDIVCSCDTNSDGIKITLRDWGDAFDPESIPDPNYAVPLEKLQSRGAGLFLMKKLMDEVTFEFDTPDGNVLVMMKKSDPESASQD